MNRIMANAAFFMVLILACGVATAATENISLSMSPSRLECEGLYKKLAGQTALDAKSRISTWLQMQSSCSDKVYFASILGSLYTDDGQYVKARGILTSAATEATPDDAKKLRYQVIEIYMLKERDFKSAEAGAAKLVADFPDWFAGYYDLGWVNIYKEDYADAIAPLEKSEQLKSDAIGTLIGLTIAYYKTHQPRNAIDAFGKAAKLDSNVFANQAALISDVYSLMAVGDFRSAAIALKLGLQINPSYNQDPSYNEAVRRMREATH